MGKKLVLSGQYRAGRNAVDVKLSLIEFEEDGLHFVYSPELDLTGYGETVLEAQDSYSQVMEEFLRYTTNKKTILKELGRLGWKISKKKMVSAPSLPELIQSRDYLVEILTEKQFRKKDQTVSIPAFV